AGGGLLERGAKRVPALPSIAALLRACASGPRVDALLADYRELRVVESRARWLAGRAVDTLDAEAVGAVAELVQPGLEGAGLLQSLRAGCARVRAAFDAVVDADTLSALER